jgi:hypothetical protein
MTATANLHHRFRGEDLERYRAALYAQWLAQRDGITIPDDRTHPDRITVEWNDDNRAKAVIFYAVGIDVRVRLP